MTTRFVSRPPVQAAATLALFLLLAGCGGGAVNTASQPPDAPHSPPPPPREPADPAKTGFNVTITSTGVIYVDNLEVEANRRRGIYAFIGFWPDQYDRMTQIPFQDVTQIDFLGPMPIQIFDVVKETRQDQALHQEHCFETYVTLKNGDKRLFYAWIPKLRGYKDFQQWEFSLNSNVNAIEKIEFNR